MGGKIDTITYKGPSMGVVYGGTRGGLPVTTVGHIPYTEIHRVTYVSSENGALATKECTKFLNRVWNDCSEKVCMLKGGCTIILCTTSFFLIGTAAMGFASDNDVNENTKIGLGVSGGVCLIIPVYLIFKHCIYNRFCREENPEQTKLLEYQDLERNNSNGLVNRTVQKECCSCTNTKVFSIFFSLLSTIMFIESVNKKNPYNIVLQVGGSLTSAVVLCIILKKCIYDERCR